MENNGNPGWTPVFTGAPRHHLPFRSVFMPIVPCVLDGVISLLELIAKLEYIVNQYHDAIEQNHTDIMNLYEYLESALDDLREYIDTQDTATLQAAKDYTDAALALIYDYIDDHDAATLQAAEAYTDAAIADLRDYVDSELAGKQDLLTFDQTPTAGSTNPVESQGIKAYIDTAISNKYRVVNITDNNGTLEADMTYSDIYLLLTRGAILQARYEQISGQGVTTRVDIMHVDNFVAAGVTFFNQQHTLTIDYMNVVTYS